MSNARVITKYPNRRLYDSTKCQYITVADIRQLVLDGIEFVVSERRTGRDITREVLLQVITEQEKSSPSLSQAFLCSLIHKHADTEDATDAPAKKAADSARKSATNFSVRDSRVA